MLVTWHPRSSPWTWRGAPASPGLPRPPSLTEGQFPPGETSGRQGRDLGPDAGPPDPGSGVSRQTPGPGHLLPRSCVPRVNRPPKNPVPPGAALTHLISIITGRGRRAVHAITIGETEVQTGYRRPAWPSWLQHCWPQPRADGTGDETREPLSTSMGAVASATHGGWGGDPSPAVQSDVAFSRSRP